MAVLGRAAQRAAVAVVALVAGCGGGGSPTADRVERCVDRLASNAVEADENVRRYVRAVYCEPFEDEGLIHEDGALRIEAVEALAGESECATAAAGEDARTTRCPPSHHVDCALLRHVRRAEVQAYLGRHAGVRCDDETPSDQLGVP